MESTIWLTALILIVCGLLAKQFPALIAGYNTMSAEEKKNVDIKGLSTFICFGLVGMGIATFIFYYVCKLLGFSSIAEYSLFLPFLYIPYLIIRSQKYDHNPRKKRTNVILIIGVVFVIGIVVLLVYSMLPATIKTNGDKLVITGMYGTERSLHEIESIELTNTLPALTMRLNGLSLGAVNKGWFKRKEGGKCLLFLSSDTKPFIVIKEKSGEEIYMNSPDSETTKQQYEELRKWVGPSLREQIQAIIQNKKATVGVAVIFEGKDTLTVNNQYHYPMMSVFKFPLALAVLDYWDKRKMPLTDQIMVREADLLPNTYSPMRETHPKGGLFSVGELLQYSVSQSDNNACDILFRTVEGTEAVNTYIASLGIKDFTIVATEAEMHEKTENQYLNWTTPLSAVRLLELFLQKDLFAPEYKDFLEKLMIETVTGPDKIKSLLPADVIVGHKTGNSSRDEAGMKIADNDLAFVRLPDGKSYSIAVFVMNSMEDDATNAAIIAEISKVVYEHASTGCVTDE